MDQGLSQLSTEQLEIFNLFMKLYKEEKIQRNIDQKIYMIEMSEEFKQKFKEIDLEEFDKIDKNSTNSI